jgi:hypothetical protein
MIEFSSLKDFLTISAAAVGAVLGIMNTWNAINQKRLKLKICPCHTIAVPHGTQGFSIEVLNISSFPVTIIEVGLTNKSNDARKGDRYPILHPIIIDNKPWPRRLEPRETVSLHSETPNHKNIGIAYARTACGEYRYGDSPALKQIRKEVRS